jgi:hypothetical protein
MVRGDVGTVLGAQQVLQQDLQTVRELVRSVDGIQPEDLIVVADLQS